MNFLNESEDSDLVICNFPKSNEDSFLEKKHKKIRLNIFRDSICAHGNSPFFHKSFEIVFFVGVELKGNTTLVLEELMKNCRHKIYSCNFLLILLEWWCFLYKPHMQK